MNILYAVDVVSRRCIENWRGRYISGVAGLQANHLETQSSAVAEALFSGVVLTFKDGGEDLVEYVETRTLSRRDIALLRVSNGRSVLCEDVARVPLTMPNGEVFSAALAYASEVFDGPDRILDRPATVESAQGVFLNIAGQHALIYAAAVPDAVRIVAASDTASELLRYSRFEFCGA